jgi:uncharacterized MAPEG superfamily protein
MTMELQMLAWAIALGFAQIAIAASMNTTQRGFAWGVGARDGTPPPVTPVAQRLARASANFLETFPLFAAAVLALMASGRTDANTALGSQIYFWARVAYLPAYASGAPYVRTLAWAASIVGLVMVAKPLF